MGVREQKWSIAQPWPREADTLSDACFAVQWGPEHLPPDVTGFEAGDSENQHRGFRKAQEVVPIRTGTFGEGQGLLWGMGGGRNSLISLTDDRFLHQFSGCFGSPQTRPSD